MRRRTLRPYGTAVPGSRLISMLMALAVIWVLYERMSDPKTWKWLADAKEEDTAVVQVLKPPVRSESPLVQPDHPAGSVDSPEGSTVPAEVAKTSPQAATGKTADAAEVVVAGPNDLDPEVLKAAQARYELVSDRAKLRPREMPVYWEFMSWARTQPMKELEKRANRDVAFTQLWEQPEKYRGEIVRFRMHVRRVLQYEAPENPAGIKEVFELWGPTEESKSFPYCVVTADRPAGLPIGSDVHAEVVFVGYFLKIMSYEAFDANRGAPLLVGRLRMASTPGSRKVASTPPTTILTMVMIVGAMMAGFYWWMTRNSMNLTRKPLPADLGDFTLPGMDVPADGPAPISALEPTNSPSTTP